MASKAQRLAAKRAARGRPYIEGKPREMNGRISRARVPRDPADRLALSVRARKMGVPIEEARDARLTTYIGRLYRLGAKHGGISREQYEAALTFLEIRNKYLWAIGSPAAIHEEGVGILDDVGYEEAVKRDKARYESMMKAIREEQFFNRSVNFYAPLQYLVIDDLELPHMVGTLRLTLNLLHRYFFIDRCMSEMN